MSSKIDSFDFALKSLPRPKNLPMALPPVHVNEARCFEKIIRDGQLIPWGCKVFGEELLYLSYGGPFYRTGHEPTRDASELPIAFLFDPSLLSSFFRYFPFDTGALANHRFGQAGERLLPLEEYAVVGDELSAPLMVHYLYETNRAYLSGRLRKDLNELPTPFPELATFFGSDLSQLGIDQRQLSIECHSKKQIPLSAKLLWVGFPDSMTDIFARLYELTKPSMPEYFQYEAHVIFHPREIAAKLELKAAEVVKRFEALPKA
jgi:hypothetical protein